MNPAAWSHEGTTDYYDQPFAYVFDGDSLTDGNDYTNLAQPLVSQSDFILRRICGLANIAGQIRFRDRNSINRQSAPAPMPRDYVVLPDIPYPPDAQIGFDLVNVLRANNPYVGIPGSVPNYFAQLGFFGVRRYWGQRAPITTYKYHSRPYVISTDVTVDWAGRIAPAYTQLEGPQQFNVLVDSHDFELQKIHAIIDTASAASTASSGKVKLTLYDQNQQALSNAPVLDSYLADNNADYSSVFPTPTLLYKANSLIRFDIMSLLLDTEVPATLTLHFIGAWRFPC